MLRAICNYLRQCICPHEFELISKITTVDEFNNAIGHRKTYRCEKCGYVQRVKL